MLECTAVARAQTIQIIIRQIDGYVRIVVDFHIFVFGSSGRIADLAYHKSTLRCCGRAGRSAIVYSLCCGGKCRG